MSISPDDCRRADSIEKDIKTIESELAVLGKDVTLLKHDIQTNTLQHQEYREDLGRIYTAIETFNSTLQREIGRRSALSWVGGIVITGIAAIFWSIFSTDIYSIVHTKIHSAGDK